MKYLLVFSLLFVAGCGFYEEKTPANSSQDENQVTDQDNDSTHMPIPEELFKKQSRSY